MTWVIGVPLVLGYGLAISDIRVRWGDGASDDCLQKIHFAGRDIAVGFAGSVWAGLGMVEALQRALRTDMDGAWAPRYVALRWRRLARRLFARFAEQCPADAVLGCHLLCVGASPVEDVGIPGYAKSYVWTIASPDFEPRFAKPLQFLSIGSGSQAAPYIEALEQAGTLDSVFNALQFEVGLPGGAARVIFDSVSEVIRRYRHPEVSEHLYLCIIRRGDVLLGTNDFPQYLHGGETVTFKMQPVAQSWEEFEEIARRLGHVAAAASCRLARAVG